MISAFSRLLRVTHWTKNLFVFLPLIYSGQFHQLDRIYMSLATFAIFSIAASLVYIFNDIIDLEADRGHPVKSVQRPLAAGDISFRQAVSVAVVLAIILISSLTQLPAIAHIIGIYLVLNVAYTLWVKHLPVWDLFTLASFYILRIYAGGEALQVQISAWMFVTVFSLSLFLASIKRRQELLVQGTAARSVLRYYSPNLMTRYAEISMTGTIVFYSLFVLTEKADLVPTIPLVLLGLFRYWFQVDQHNMGESPIAALLQDRQMIFIVIVWAAATVFLLG